MTYVPIPGDIGTFRNSCSARKRLLFPPLVLQSVGHHPQAALPAGPGPLLGVVPGSPGPCGARLLGWHVPSTILCPVTCQPHGSPEYLWGAPGLAAACQPWLWYSRYLLGPALPPSPCRGTDGAQVCCVHAGRSWETHTGAAWAEGVGQAFMPSSERPSPGSLRCLPASQLPCAPQTRARCVRSILTFVSGAPTYGVAGPGCS